MIYLYILIGLGILGLLYMRFEAGFVEVRHVRLTKSKKHLKIVHLSDIHVDHLKISPRRVREAILHEKPDFIVFTGDYINKSSDASRFLDFLDGISAPCTVYACLGNHDYEAFQRDAQGLERFLDDIRSKGVIILHNASDCFVKNSRKYNIMGIPDKRYKHHDIEGALKTKCNDAFANIAFSHNPDIVLDMPRNSADYLLCGHFHGGQIWMPFDLEFRLLRYEKLCRMGVKRGLHKVNGINLYINRGLGNVLFPLRFFSRPEITVLYIP